MANELLIKINADSKNVSKAFDDVKKQTKELEGQLNEIALVAGVSFAALTAGIGFAVVAYDVAEKSVSKLTESLQAQGIFTTELRDSYREYSEEVERATGVDADALIRGQALAQGFLGQTKITRELTQAIADLAVSKGIGLEQAATLVGKSIGTSTNALAREGLEISATATKTERYAQVLAFLQGRYSGQAQAAGEGIGALTKLKNSFGTLTEAIGQRFAPAVERGATTLKNLIDRINEDEPLLNFVSIMIQVGISISGTVLVATLAAKVFITLKAAMVAAGVAAGGLRLAISALVGATGIGLIVLALTQFILDWEGTWARARAIFNGFLLFFTQAAQGIGTVIEGIFSRSLGTILNGIKQIKEAVSAGASEAFKTIETEETKAAEKQKEIQKKAADQREAQAVALEGRRAARIRAENDLISLQLQDASDLVLDNKKREVDLLRALENETNEQRKALLLQQLEEVREQEEEILAQDIERKRAFAAEKAIVDDELRQQGIAIDDEARAEDLRKAEAGLKTEQEIDRKIADEALQTRVKNRNLELEDRRKYGVAIATINTALRSNEVQGAKAVGGELVELANSKNATLKKIGQAAAISQITIATAESAVTIFQQVLRVIPAPFGIPVAAALAAARVAYGAEQISNVRGAQDGALVEGPGRGDSVPFLLEPGELVTPRKNFEEVVGGVQSSRNNKDAEILATLQEISNKPSGSTVTIQGDVLAEESYIDRLVEKISDAFEFRNAKVFGVNT